MRELHYFYRFEPRDNVKAWDIFFNHIARMDGVTLHDRAPLAEMLAFVEARADTDAVMVVDLAVELKVRKLRESDVFKLLMHVRDRPPMRLRVVFMTCDYWVNPTGNWAWWNEHVFKARNHHVVTIARSAEVIEYFHQIDLSRHKHLILEDAGMWDCYADVPFQPDPPIAKVCVSGRVGPRPYPERTLMLEVDGAERLPQVNRTTDDFCGRLSQYLCCHSASVYSRVKGKPNVYENTHEVLLKTYEILSTGSLLLAPAIEAQYLERQLGIKPGVHYVEHGEGLAAMQRTVDWILDVANRAEVDAIRRRGYDRVREAYAPAKVATRYYRRLMALPPARKPPAPRKPVANVAAAAAPAAAPAARLMRVRPRGVRR